MREFGAPHSLVLNLLWVAVSLYFDSSHAFVRSSHAFVPHAPSFHPGSPSQTPLQDLSALLFAQLKDMSPGCFVMAYDPPAADAPLGGGSLCRIKPLPCHIRVRAQIRLAPLVRVNAKLTVKIAVSCCRRLPHTANLTVNLTMTSQSYGAAFTERAQRTVR